MTGAVELHEDTVAEIAARLDFESRTEKQCRHSPQRSRSITRSTNNHRLELRKTQTGKLVTNFGLAHNFRERAGNQFKDVTTVFFDASVWEEDGAAEVAELGLTKGTRVTVEGVWSKRTRTTKG